VSSDDVFEIHFVLAVDEYIAVVSSDDVFEIHFVLAVDEYIAVVSLVFRGCFCG
jgi:hypothetical protein